MEERVAEQVEDIEAEVNGQGVNRRLKRLIRVPARFNE